VRLNTDHHPLTYLKDIKVASRRQARWIEFFERFDYTSDHHKGSDNVVADCPSRCHDFTTVPASICSHAAREALVPIQPCASTPERSRIAFVGAPVEILVLMRLYARKRRSGDASCLLKMRYVRDM
jgi:hypothetical protein